MIVQLYLNVLLFGILSDQQPMTTYMSTYFEKN